MKKTIRTSRGITLIALVITIIVLLILATVSIATLTGKNGILTKSQQAVETHKKAEYAERIQLIGLGLQADKEEWDKKTYMKTYAKEIKADELFKEAEVKDPVLYKEKLIIEITTKEGWIYWVTENDVELRQTGGIPKVEPTDVYVALVGNTLKFYRTESEVPENADKIYGNIKDLEFIRTSWGKSSALWDAEKDQIEIVEFVEEIAPKNMANYFYFFKNLKEIRGIENLKTDNVTSMYSTFGGCTSLTNLNVSKFNTSQVTNMNSMFFKCKFSQIDVTNFNTENVTDMNSMFCNCDNLESLDVTNFNTSKVMDMGFMFQNARKLKNINLSDLDTENVTTMRGMFSECNNLGTLDLSNFNTTNVTDMETMFYNCNSLTNLKVTGFDTSKVTTMKQMFCGCNSLIELNLANFNTEKVTDMFAMFLNCNKITKIDISKFNTDKVTDMQEMFSCCYELQELDVAKFNTPKVKNFTCMFFCCHKLKELNCCGFEIQSTAVIKQMFDQCPLEKLDIRKFNLENHTADKTSLFAGVKDEAEITTNQKMKIWLNTNYARFTSIIAID